MFAIAGDTHSIDYNEGAVRFSLRSHRRIVTGVPIVADARSIGCGRDVLEVSMFNCCPVAGCIHLVFRLWGDTRQVPIIYRRRVAGGTQLGGWVGCAELGQIIIPIGRQCIVHEVVPSVDPPDKRQRTKLQRPPSPCSASGAGPSGTIVDYHGYFVCHVPVNPTP